MQILDDWKHILENNNIDDIEFTSKYANLYDQAFMYLFEKNNNTAFIIINENRTYNDFETPYGYGSFYTNNYNTDFLNDFFICFKKETYKRELIAGIIRFNPLYNIPLNNLNTVKIRDIVTVDINNYENQLNSSCKNMIKRVKRESLNFYESKSKNDIIDFYKSYSKIIKAKESDPLLLFDNNYFRQLILFDETIMIICRDKNDVFIGGSIFLITNNGVSYYHLSVLKDRNIPGVSNYILKNGIEAAKKKKSHTMILGGGITNDKNDPLLKFKLSFSNELKPFYLGKIIIDKDEYSKKIDEYDKKYSKYRSYFLRYRYNE